MVTGYASIDSTVMSRARGRLRLSGGAFARGQLEVVLRRIKDRMALEEENRELSRRVVGHETHPAGGDLTWRLQAIEERLAHIEALLKGRV
jgi:hypothetical protein